MESSFFYYLCLKSSLLGVYKNHTTLDVIGVVIFIKPTPLALKILQSLITS